MPVDVPADEYRIRPARPEEAGRLRHIEDAAGTMFAGTGLVDEVYDESFPLDRLRHLIDAGQVWVVCGADDVPVGAVIAAELDGTGYVEEIDVLPEYGRRGLGGRLLEHACAWARERGYPAMTLSTFRDVPWNGPFYRGRGFRDLAPDEWTPGMSAIRDTEAAQRLRVEARVFMRREFNRNEEEAP